MSYLYQYSFGKGSEDSDSSSDKIMTEVIFLQVPDCKSFLKVI